MTDKVYMLTVSRGDDIQFIGVFTEYMSAYNFIPRYTGLMGIENNVLSSVPMGTNRVQITTQDGLHHIRFVIHTLLKSQLEVIP